jgi:hypothetical protein
MVSFVFITGRQIAPLTIRDISVVLFEEIGQQLVY